MPPVTLPADARPAASEGSAVGPIATVRLSDGRDMPVFGLGVYRCKPGEETYRATRWALELGYRLVDTAALYRNEESVGQAIKDSGVPRSEVWVTTKLWDSDHGYDRAIQAFRASLRKLALDYVDLYLIHSPNKGKLVETWDALLELKRQGLARSVGVSNFGVEHLEALRSHGREPPAVNQFEMHPLVFRERKGVVDYCQTQGISITAYGSVFSGHRDMLGHRTVTKIAAAHAPKTGAQVALRWGLQIGFALIPKSVHRERLAENMDIFDFELSPQELEELTTMRGSLHEYWDPLSAAVDLGRLDRGRPGPKG